MKAALISKESGYSVKMGTDVELYEWLQSELDPVYHRLFWLDGAGKLQVDYNHRLDWRLKVGEASDLFDGEFRQNIDFEDDLNIVAARLLVWARAKKEDFFKGE